MSISKLAEFLNIAERNFEEGSGYVERISTLTAQKEALKKEFYKKYSRFIQEGTWTDENYIDDELYYADAVRVAALNATPKVSYNIDVANLENTTNLSMYNFKIGQKTYIEDPEFFGYKYVDAGAITNIKTPAQKEVIVSEISKNYNDPNKNKITIKTYRNQYEELFLSMQSAAQTLTYNEGSYSRAAQAVLADGTISASYIEKTFAENTLLLASAVNESVTWNTGNGIEIKNETNPNELIRIISGGIWISNNGENYLRKVLDANGIYPSYLRSGNIRADVVNIVSGELDTFKWDGSGITAYATSTTNGITTVDQSKYVKFNLYGLYSYDGRVTSLSILIGPNCNDNSSGTEYKARNLNEFLEKSGNDFDAVKSSTTILSNYVYNNFKLLNENTTLYSFILSYISTTSEPTLSDLIKFKTYNSEILPEDKYYGASLPSTIEGCATFTLYKGDQIKYTDSPDIYTSFPSNATYYVNGTGQDLDTYISRSDVTESNKIQYIQDNSSFSLTWHGLDIQGASSLLDDAVKLTPTGGIEIFGRYPNIPGLVYTFGSDIINSTYESLYGPTGVRYTTGLSIPLVSLGKFYNKGGTIDQRCYGLRMRTKEGKVSLLTDNEGHIWSKDKIFVGEDEDLRLVKYCDTSLDGNIFRYVLEKNYENYKISSISILLDITVGSFIDEYQIILDEFKLYNNGKTGISGFTRNTVLPSNTSWYTLDTSSISDLLTSASNFYEINNLNYSIPLTSTDSDLGSDVHWHLFKYYDDIYSSRIVGLNSTDLTVELLSNLYSIRNKFNFLDTIFEALTPLNRTVLWFLDNYNLSITDFNYLNNMEATPSDTIYAYTTYYYYDRSTYGVSIWCGQDSNYNNSNFIVFKNGSVYIKSGYFEGNGVFLGNIKATSGEFTGSIKVGNDTIINGSSSASNVITAGNNFTLSSTGLLTANSATIIGNITANSGLINNISLGSNSGLSGTSNISLWINATNNDLASSVFYVTNSGILHSKSLLLEGPLTSTYVSNNIDASFGIASESYAFWAYDGLTSKYYFTVDKTGNVMANNLTLNSALYANNANLNGSLKVGNITIGSNSIYQNNNLWSINDDGTAKFKNVEVNGKISSAVFELNKTSGIGGSLFISPAVTLQSSLTYRRIGATSEIRYRLSDSDGLIFKDSKTVTVHLIDGTEYSGSIKTETENNSDIIYEIAILVNDDVPQLGKGTNIIATDIETGSYIELTAQGGLNSNPLIHMHGNQIENLTLILNDVYIGNLNGINSSEFGTLSGYGLYGDNVYLNGKLFLPNAGITNSGTSSSDVRIWAGSSAANKENAPFRVLHDGTIYASKGRFSGTVEATGKSTFSGWIKTAGILIDKEDLDGDKSDHFYVAYDGDTSDSTFPTVDDKILDISKDGLSVWEGAFRAYSDYDNNILYKTVLNTREQPIPYISAIDDKTDKFSRMYLKALNIGEFKINGNDPNNDVHSINNICIREGKIQFGVSTLHPEGVENFLDLEKNSIKGDTWIRWLIANNNDKFEITFRLNSNYWNLSDSQDGITLSILGSLKINGSEYFTTYVSDSLEDIVRVSTYYSTKIEQGIDLFV